MKTSVDVNKIPVFMKDSLIPVVGMENMRREFRESCCGRKNDGAEYETDFV